MSCGRLGRLGIGALAICVLTVLTAVRAGAATGPLQFGPAALLAGAAGGTEPRVAVAPDGTLYAVSGEDTISSAPTVPLTVYASHDAGVTWAATRGAPSTLNPTADVDIVATRTGRLVVAELDSGGLNIVVSYSDDGGATWTLSTGADRLVDQDRPWLAVGPDDPGTHQARVYLLFHQLFSGNVTQNMYVEPSTDGGATFGAPVPLTQPGSDAFLDLQCGASTGPADLVVNQTTGRLYAFWGTRHGPLGGCANTPPQPTTIVAQDRLWAATSPDGSLGSWTDSVAVDDAAAGQLVGMQLAPGAVDNAGNVYVVYPESPAAFPDFTGAAVRVRWAAPDLAHWSVPVTVAPAAQPGNVLAHIVAGDPGSFDVAYFAGVGRGAALSPQWYMTVARVTNGLSATPTVTTQRLSATPAYSGTASDLMGWCDAQALQTGVTCNRSSDVWGIALDARCNLIVSWPSLSPTTDATLGASVDATWVDVQTGGPSLCGLVASTPEAPGVMLLPLAGGAVIAVGFVSRRRRRGLSVATLGELRPPGT